MKFISLFAGIGGFDLGLERAGMQCVGQVEINPFCQRVLAHHWPKVKRIGDIRNVNGTEFGAVDLVCGGFPCQPFSHAGKRRGKEDDRYLWPEMLRVIQAYRPAWVLGENVAGIVSMALDTVLSDLEAQGYQCEAFIIPACAVDAKHERKRVYIIARRRCEIMDDTESRRCRFRNSAHIGQVEGNVNALADTSQVVAHAESVGSRRGLCQAGQEQNGNQLADSGSHVPDSHGAGFRERRRAESIQPEQHSAQCAGQDVPYAVNNGYNRAEGNEAEPSGNESNDRLFERGYTWEPEPELGRVANGVPGRVDRLRSLGNAVVPEKVEAIGRAIIQAEEIDIHGEEEAAAEHYGNRPEHRPTGQG